MPGHSVKLVFTTGACTYVSPRTARQLEGGKHAYVLSRTPYVLRMKAETQEIVHWSTKSEGLVMNGAALMRRLPPLGEGNCQEMKISEKAQLRKRAGLTQHRLAKLTGIRSATISLWENGEVDLPPELVERIGRVIATELGRRPAFSTNEILNALAPAKSLT